jgi:hypothetical protein
MARKSDQPSADDNLVIVVCFLTLFAGLSAFSSAYIAGVVLDTLQSRDALVMIVTDAGIKSDSVSVEQGLSSATTALLAVRDLGMALSIGCLGVGLALGIRQYKANNPLR